MSRLSFSLLGVFVLATMIVACAPAAPPTPTPPPAKAPVVAAPTAAPAAPAKPTAAAPAPAPPKAAPSPAPKTLENVTLQFSIGASGVSAPYYLGVDKGYFRDVGLNVTLIDGSGSGTTAQVVANGGATFGNVDASTVALLVSQGVQIKSIATIVQKSVIGVISLAETGIKQPKDLEGKQIAHNVGGAAANLFPTFLAANDVDIKKLTLLNMSVSATVAAVRQKQVHATPGFLTSAVVPVEADGVKTSVLLYSDYGANTLGDTLVTGPAMIQQKPDLVRRFVGAAMRAWEDAAKNPDEAVRIFMRAKPEAKEVVARGQLKVYIDRLHSKRTTGKPIGVGDPEDWEETIAILAKTGMLKERKAANQYFTNEFLPKP